MWNKTCNRFHLHVLIALQILISQQSNFLVVIRCNSFTLIICLFFIRSLDSRSTSLEGIGQITSCIDSDSDDELDLPDWASNVSAEVLSQLSSKEKKRQEVINELYHTERSHIRGKIYIIYLPSIIRSSRINF